MTDASCDYLIIGGGIAGASLAAELAGAARVIVVEREDQPGYHSTGRSAAFWSETYGGPRIAPLTLASGDFLHEGGYLTPRGALHLARRQDSALVDQFLAEFAQSAVTIERVGRDTICRHVPGLRPEWVEGVWEPSCADIDVAALHEAYLSTARAQGAQIRCRAAVVSLDRYSGGWKAVLADGEQISARRIINAAGAWADEVAQVAGIAPLGIAPLLRTVAQLRVDRPVPASLPLVLGIRGDFYFKPESGRLWLSPHDETPSPATDVAADELAVAMAIDRMEAVVDWRVDLVERKWAGLRSFAPDRLPVYGPDPADGDFIWFAGQGGFGIQTAPAAAQLLADQLLGRRSPAVANIDIGWFSPDRFNRT